MAETNFFFATFCIFLGLQICFVKSASFKFGDGQQICILLDIDASFDLSKGEGEKQKADPFSLDGANVTAGQSLCGSDMSSAALSLSLFPSNEMFKINFRKDVNAKTLSMSAVLFLDPKKHFENATELPFELESSLDLPIGMRNMSYKCNSEQTILFNQDPGFSMTMSITNLHVQAYDVENGEFSPASECEQDEFTTPPTTSPPEEPTTTSKEPETTTPEKPITVVTETTTPEKPITLITETTSQETPITFLPETTSQETPATLEPEMTTVNPNENATTPEPEKTTTEMEPTITPKIIPKYEVKEKDSVCIVIQGKIRFDITYETKDNVMNTSSIDIPETVTVTGSCRYNGTNTTQELKLTFFDNKWSLTLLIAEDTENLLKSSGHLLQDLKIETSYSWQNIELIYVLDNEHFVNPKESGLKKIVTKNVAGNFKASTEGSYKCTTGETIQLEENIAVDLKEFQYKAFNTDNSGDFPDDGMTACPADNPDDDDDDDENTVAIVLGAVFGGLAFIILVVAIGICVRRNRYKNYEVM